MRSVVGRILERHGYVVLEASRGDLALELVRREAGRIDLLLTDLLMPEMSGHELAEQFRALRSDAKVLYMSGQTEDSILPYVRGEDEHYIEKPFSVEMLAGKVRELLDAG